MRLRADTPDNTLAPHFGACTAGRATHFQGLNFNQLTRQHCTSVRVVGQEFCSILLNLSSNCGATSRTSGVISYQETVAFPDTPPYVALMVEVPLATEVANPVVETVATAVLLDAQVADVVTSWVDESEKVATARNCCVWLAASGFQVSGVTATLTTVLLLTVRVVLALTLPVLQEIVVLPSATPVASPVLLMVAIFVEDEVQVTSLVASPVVLLP